MLDSTPKTVTIQLTKGYEATVDECDADLAEFNWQVLTPKGNRTCYAQTHVYRNGQRTTKGMHVIILERMLKTDIPSGFLVDHENTNGLDNRRSNLRLASKIENMQNSNKPTRNTSGYKGVGFCKRRNKWRAYIGIEGRQKSLGYYLTPEDAYAAYCEAARKYFGEFARLD